MKFLKKIDSRRGACLMAVLMLSFEVPSVSELPAATSNLTITPPVSPLLESENNKKF